MSDLTRPPDRGDGSSTAARSPGPAFPDRVPKGAPVHANSGAIHRLRVAPSRSMKAIAGEIEAMLDGMEESSRRSSALLASELIAQVTGRTALDGEPVGLTIQLREDDGSAGVSLNQLLQRHRTPHLARSWRSSGRSRTNERSILSEPTGKRVR